MLAIFLVAAGLTTTTQAEPRRSFDEPLVLLLARDGSLEVRGARCDVVRFMEAFQAEMLPGWDTIIPPDQAEATRYGWGECVPLIGLRDDETITVLARHLKKWHGKIEWRLAPREAMEVPPAPDW